MGDIARIAIKIAKIAGRQHGNIIRQQLLALGVSSAWIGRQQRVGRLYRVLRGVYSVGHPPTKPIERAAAAVLACGPRAVLSHGSAMTLWGFWERCDQPFEVTLAADRRPRGIRVHRCSTLLSRDLRTRDGIRVTSPARTSLDMAPWLRRRSLTRPINNARRAHLLTLTTWPTSPIAIPPIPGPRCSGPTWTTRRTRRDRVARTTSRPSASVMACPRR